MLGQAHRAGVAVAAGGGDLRAPPIHRVGLCRVEARIDVGAIADGVAVGPRSGGVGAHGQRRRGRDQRRHAVIGGGGRADVEIGAGRGGDAFGEERAHRLTGDPAHDFSHEIALGQGVVATAAARFPPRLLRRQQRRALLPVVEIGRLQALRPARKPRSVRQQVPDQHVVLAGGLEAGPVAGHWRVDIDQAVAGTHEQRQAAHGLRGGEHVDDRVALPSFRAFGVEMAAPQVDDQLAVDGHGHRGAEVAVVGEVGQKRLAHLGEAFVEPAVDRHIVDRGPALGGLVRRGHRWRPFTVGRSVGPVGPFRGCTVAARRSRPAPPSIAAAAAG